MTMAGYFDVQSKGTVMSQQGLGSAATDFCLFRPNRRSARDLFEANLFACGL
ncbi:hypothetical protein FB480_10477 [Agrobacterium vitis]|nr:hypothetical protein FB480_10477 [Agrobacterium vitis]